MATGSGAADGPRAEAAAPAPPAAQPLRSLRSRLAWTLSGLVLVMAVLQALLLNWSAHQAEESMIDRILAEQVARSIAIHRTQPELAFPQDGDMRLYLLREPGDGTGEGGRAGESIGSAAGAAAATLPPYLRALPREPGRHELHPAANIEYHVAIARSGDTLFYLVYDVAEHEKRQRDTWAVLILSVIAVSGLVGLLAHRLAARLLRDLDRLARAAAGAEGGRGAFAPLAEHRETGALADALDAWRDRVGVVIERERAFAAAANHELRTPLMRASSTLELLAAGLDDARAQELAKRIASAHEELRMLTESLLRVARGITASAVKAEPLARLAEDVLGNCEADARMRGISLENLVDPALRQPVDRGALTIVLLNLLRNAIRHSGARKVTIAWHQDCLLVDDDGIGFGAADGSQAAAADGDEAAGRDRRAGTADLQALGVGLTIVERICEACGWELRFAARPGGGTRVSVRLGAGSAGGASG